MKISYGVTEEVYVIGFQSRVSYGIAAYADSDAEGTASILSSVRDISSDRASIEELAGLCNRLELDVIHLIDAVEDFLGQI